MEDYDIRHRDSHTWTTSAVGLEAEVEVRSWPEHEKIIRGGNGMDEEEDSDCKHLHAMAVNGKARCHGCLQLFHSLNRCVECHIELCIGCRPQMPNLDLES
jgi:hypothetical protein